MSAYERATALARLLGPAWDPFVDAFTGAASASCGRWRVAERGRNRYVAWAGAEVSAARVTPFDALVDLRAWLRREAAQLLALADDPDVVDAVESRPREARA